MIKKCNDALKDEPPAGKVSKRTQSKRTQYDQSYKRLFSHPKMVEDLLRGFIHKDWVKELDFSTLEVFKDSFVSDNLLVL